MAYLVQQCEFTVKRGCHRFSHFIYNHTSHQVSHQSIHSCTHSPLDPIHMYVRSAEGQKEGEEEGERGGGEERGNDEERETKYIQAFQPSKNSNFQEKCGTYNSYLWAPPYIVTKAYNSYGFTNTIHYSWLRLRVIQLEPA